ncbi:MAG: serine/threonine protein kinase [Deltaproteobacteria bacterium]|nr:serine/threonine protein kinase [Deltaproteobacteria bacterium]
MRDPGPTPVGESTEEGRALLQVRVALFWKVMFFISLLSVVLGAVGAIVKPGLEMVVGLAQLAQTGAIWWICSRGQRSARFYRVMETAGLLVNVTASALLGRHVVVEFAAGHSFLTPEGALMSDAYITLLHVAGIGLLLAVRAALVPSSPRRTISVTAIVGAPLIASIFLVQTAEGGFAWRALDSDAYPWMPGTAAMMWGYVIITCTVISWVIFGLRAEVREARRLGQYVLERKIGEGGMGEVYLAHHGMMRRPSALKLMRSDQAGAGNLLRFEREVQLTARLTHPNTITIFDYGRTHDGVFYYAMELLDGATLQRIVALDGAQPAGRVVRILSMACRALTEAHGIGLIHRDIKPANIMLCTQGGEWDVVKLLDFGLVKELAVDGDVKLTGASTLTGTPQYMAPESILSADAADARTDIYALGAVAYFLLSGSDVFEGKSVVEICSQHLHQAPKPLSARGVTVPAELEAVVLACLEKKPADRPQSAAELRRRLEACPVEPWDSEDARAWWSQHQAALDGAAAQNPAGPRTIAIDGAPRLSRDVAA